MELSITYNYIHIGQTCRLHTTTLRSDMSIVDVMDPHDAITLYVFSAFIWFSNRLLHLVINV